jgi:hypothetical protein
MRCDDLPLFTWQSPECHLIPFPLSRRIGKVRDVAMKLLEKTTDRHADYYRNQVADALFKQLSKLGVPEIEQDEQVGAFFCKVEQEISRLTYRGSKPGGAA